MTLQTLVSALAIGCLVGGSLHLLRQTIDRHRGLLAEVLAVGLSLLIACVLVALTVDPFASSINWGLRLAPMVELVFVALPVLMVCRAVERLREGGQLQISDLFRLTTAAAAALFVLTSLHNPLGFADILLVTAVYLAAEWAMHTRNPHRNLASVFSLSLITCIFVNIAFARSFYSYFCFDDLLPTGRQGMLGLVVFMWSLVATPFWVEWLTRHIGPIQSLAVSLAAWRLASVSPAQAITLQPLLRLWRFREGVCYLNHGSFGAVPLAIRQTQQQIRIAEEDEPLDFLARQVEPRWFDARLRLAAWLGTQAENIAFCENATAGMNEIAHWFPLRPGDEVLMNDHEYGAVKRIWQRKCDETEAKLVFAELPLSLSQPQQITDTILANTNQRTKLVVASHITSPTAMILPVEQLCRELKKRSVPICIDGPHALLQQPLKLYSLDCDFYTASCHKWLCAPVGSGFVYAAPQWHAQFRPARLSWGRLDPGKPQSWCEELLWTGTRDYSAYLTVPEAIRFFQRFDAQQLDDRNHALACYARERLLQLPESEPVTPAGREWFGWMVAVWLPPGDHSTLQQRLWQNYRIEVPIVHFARRWLVRVSCHLYNSTADIDRLIRALSKELRGLGSAS